MRRIGLLFLPALALALPGCQRDESQVGEKLDQIIKQNEQILQSLQSGAARGPGAAAAAAQRPPERKRPDPQEVYAVPANGPSRGVKDATITIVEAFTFT
jgi:hypothetical protein